MGREEDAKKKAEEQERREREAEAAKKEPAGPAFELSGASQGATGDKASASARPKLNPEEEAMMQSALNDPRLQASMLASDNPEQVKLGKLMGAFRAASMAQQKGPKIQEIPDDEDADSEKPPEPKLDVSGLEPDAEVEGLMNQQKQQEPEASE